MIGSLSETDIGVWRVGLCLQVPASFSPCQDHWYLAGSIQEEEWLQMLGRVGECSS